MSAQVWDANLPPDWTCCVTSDGRIFFLNDTTRENSWLHPITNLAVQTGHRSLIDLPQGWERGVTNEGVTFYIDHNNQQTTYVHPTTGRSEVQADAVQSPSPESFRYDVSSPSFSLFNGTLPDTKKQANRKSYVGSWVKGPFLRRPDPSSVTHQGWLLKQGSDGFQLWKRRWFVLSDYCLYYYKSQQEGKVLGYIPLPSFKIRPVSPEDRVYKGFAFKAEHANTRSYFFAAETKDQMTQWMNALSLASILQKDTSQEDKNSSGVVVSALKCDRPSVSSCTSSNTPTTPSADDSDSGFHGYKSKRFLSPETKSPVIFETGPNDLLPLDAQSFDEISDSSKLTGDRLNISADSCKGLRTGNRQPFYANAPPKPRRLNSSYEHSSTPDRSPLVERRDFINQQQIFQHPHSDPVEVRQPRRSSVYATSSERRTPEAYGATSTASRGDYEDVYGGTYDPHQKINQPHQRESFASSRSGGTLLSEDVNSQNQFHSPLPTHKEDSLPRNWHLTPRRPIGPPRPHSADFLEYDRKHGSSRMISQVKRNGADALQSRTQEPRPKSTVGYHHEGDFWSEENYAAKMRESAIYKKTFQANIPRHVDHVGFPDQSPSTCFNSVYQQRSWDSPQQPPVEQRVPPAGAATPDLYVPQVSMHPQDTSFSNTSTKSGHSKRGTDPIHQYDDLFNQDHKNSNLPSEQNNFLRSASARITRNVRLNDSLNTSYTDDSPDSEKKIQQREESMKRLLEWKQRMLQSPLTRKSSSRPDSSASSSASTKITNGTRKNISPQHHYESESYRQQVLKELNSQEMRTQINAREQISKGEGQHLNEKLPSAKCATNKFHNGTSHVAYNSPCEKTSVERPSPQGGSEDSNDFTSVSLNGRRRVDGKRDLSRTRHISGGDSRRSASSSSRYNSYSSDEQDVVEERSTRRKTRKSSRRNSSDQKPDSPNKKTPNSSTKTVNSCFENEMSREFCSPSHDYVNINSLEESVLLANKSNLNQHSNGLDINVSERAVPVFIDDNDVWKREESKNMVFNDKYFAARDPYYVADVQIPSLSEASLNDSGKEMTHGNRASPIGSVIKQENKLPEPEYENTNINVRQSKDTTKEPSLFSGQIDKVSNIYYNSIDASNNKHYNALYETSSCDLLQELKNDLSYNNYQDDNSIGKYSDSGYDTLRAEIPIKKEDKWDPKSQNGSNENNFDNSVASRRGSGKTKRPETWSPDKFDRSRNNIDSKSKVEESQIVKEYSYEYIILEKSKDSTPNNLRDMSLNLKMSSPNLPSLESPRMVQETQQATTNKNLVKDRIKCFSSISEPNNSHEGIFLNNCRNESSLKSNEVMNSSVCPDDNKLNDDFNSRFIPTMSPEVYEANLNEEFVSSISTKIETHEAQVKILTETNNEFSSHGISPTHDSNISCSDSHECRDPKSPQDIMDGRLNRLNIRKFVFDDTETVNTKNDDIRPAEISTLQNHKHKRSVKDLLKSFELKLENAHDSNSNFHKEDYKRKFYSDSELLSNESSSDDSDRENILDGDKLPPPPASFLEDLRKEAKVHQQETLPSLVPPPRPPKKVHLNCDIDSKGRPRSIRFSLAESIEESLRRSESENEENGWFDTPSLNAKGSNSTPSYHNRIHNNNSDNNNTFVIDMDKPPQVQAPPPPTMSVEENYLPMSPPKKPGHGGSSVGLSSSNSSLSSKHLPTPEPMYLDQFCKTELEEHMYIEMSGEPSPKSKYDMRCQTELPKLDVNIISDAHFLSPESPRYYEIGEKEGQHYEYIYKTGSHYEAIYMEVPNRDREANKPEDKPAIPNKPHDLKHMKPFHKKCSSDSALVPGLKYRSNKAYEGSSDADDEASKDLDSIELPKKPRFSLSDTFRPASYYLSGADLSTDIDAHDSSDSDLVSPPPIPMSLPPTEDSDCKDGLKTTKNNYDSKNASFNSPSHNSSFSSNSSKTLKFIANDGKEFKLASPHCSHRRSDSGSISNKYKRRPLLEETLDELNDESFVLRSEDIYPTSIRYSLGRSSLISDKSSPWSRGKSSMGNSEMSLLMDNDAPQRPSSSLSLNLSLQGRLDSTYASGHHKDVIKERIYENGHLRHCASGTSISAPYGDIPSSSNVTKNLEDCITDFHHSLTLSPNASLHDTSHISCNSGNGQGFVEQGVEDCQDHDISIHGRVSSSGFNFHQRSSSELSNQGLNGPYNSNVQNISVNSNHTPVHFRGASTVSNNSETSPRTAPYYYSDVIKDESLPLFDESSHNPRTRAYQLNNQRDLEANKRQDIGRKVNQISNTLSMDISNRERLQYELRHSFDLFDGKTTGVPDERNVYEADTLRKMKTRTLSPDPENTTKNLYPYGISLKSDSPSSGFPSHRRSRSLEGLVEDLGPRQRKRIRDWIGSNDAAQANNVFQHDISISSINNDASFTEQDDRQHNSSLNHQLQNSPQISDRLHISSPHQIHIPERQRAYSLHRSCTPDGNLVSSHHIHSIDRSFSSHGVRYPDRSISSPLNVGRPMPVNNYTTQTAVRYNTTSPISVHNDFPQSQTGHFTSHNRIASPFTDQHPQQYYSNVETEYPIQERSPQFPSSQQALSKDTAPIEPRDGSASRLSHHEAFSFESGEADNWEDDCQWREQLRRASLRHTKSLETLDEPRPRSRSDYAASTQEPPSPGKLSLPGESRKHSGVKNFNKSLDEYHVDYRVGKIPPGNSHNETLERNRKGLTTVEEYEWDTIEERFMKPEVANSTAMKSVLTSQPAENGQSFLAEGLPPSLEKETEPKNMLMKIHSSSIMELSTNESQSNFKEQFSVNEVSKSEEGGRSLGSNLSPNCAEKDVADINSLDGAKDNQDSWRKSIRQVGVAPDLIPNQDVTKLGEALHGRSDLRHQKITKSKFGMQSDSPLSNYSYGFGSTGYNNPNTYNNSQNYQPHPHANNPYHHYKSDDLLKYANHHPQPPQYQSHPNQQEQTYNPAYQNLRHQPPTYGEYQAQHNAPYDRLNSSPYHQFPAQDLQDYYHNTRNADYGSYDQEFREIEHLRQEEQMYQRQQELAYQQQYPEPELPMDKLPSSSTQSLMTSSAQRSGDEDALSSSKNFMSTVSAGELLGKTHEELVLLLIQLRRHQSALLAARRHTTLERDSQTRLAQLDNEHTEEHLQRIAYLEEHLQDLDKQYQMGKPLINLVDNMVKLGSLYRGFDSRSNPQTDPRIAGYESPNQESLEFSRRVLEKRILAEDRREYDSATPDQIDLEGKVMELYKLEKILQEESLTIQTLQRDKDMLERTLETLHSRAQGTNESMMELGRRNLQRVHLEKELSTLRSHLAMSARRLEETAVENNRLEHEMMMLRQKIQANMVRNAQRETEGTSEARHIESEMLRVQSLLEHLQKRRLELSQQIQRLTSTNTGDTDQRPSPTGISDEGSLSSRRKHTTWLETDLDRMITRDRGSDPPLDKRGRSPTESLYSNSPLYSRGTNMSDYAKRSNFSNSKHSLNSVPDHISRGGASLRSESHYRVNLGDDLPVLSLRSPSKSSLIDDDIKSSTSYGSYEVGDNRLRSLTNTPLDGELMMDRNAVDNKPDGEEQRSSPLNLDINDADDRMKRYYGILPKEKLLEPKTVRIVKRESTERKKDRYYPADKMGSGEAQLSHVDEDDLESDHSDIENYPPAMTEFSGQSASLPRNYGRANPLERANVMANTMRPSNNRSSHPVSSSGAMARPSNLPLQRKQPGVWKKNDSLKERPMSAHEQLFGTRREVSPPSSPSKSDPPSPVFKSAAAREIIKEMAWEAEKHRRAVPKEKRRHYTISSSRPLTLESGIGPEEGARSRDDCDMVRALRPRNHPDVVKSTLSSRDVRFNESTIDTILGAPQKIHIPERYMPDEDDEKELSNEEKLQREQKATAIRKMLTESSSTMTKPDTNSHEEGKASNSHPTGETSAPSKAKLDAEKKEREHILAMNQILAKQVMEKSRMVAAHNST